jgi:hypothetical protein
MGAKSEGAASAALPGASRSGALGASRSNSAEGAEGAVAMPASASIVLVLADFPQPRSSSASIVSVRTTIDGSS